ncbi:hypothetical protein Zmor_017147 [Zophobas morio]|uniref:Protein quiver n=1 Tax=Zophobas morio TaxID=2755281 RepID=A0AA38IB06_9CUCU|nr:hypothetical protein Zmor_017147 [Zophobas morio]
MKFFVLCFIAVLLHTGLTLVCFSCQQSYRTRTACSTTLPNDMVEECSETNAMCVQAVEWFQNGSLQLVRRACWSGDFCKNYTKQGQLKQCKTCTTDRCNNQVLYDPIAPPQCS